MIKRRFVYGVLLVLCVCAGVYVWQRDAPAPVYDGTRVRRGTVEHVVSVTGHVEPMERLVLAFPVGGRIERIPVSEGSPVAYGALIAALDAGSLDAARVQAEAQLAHEEAALTALIAPVRPEDRALKEAALAAAASSVIQAEARARVVVEQAYNIADDALYHEADKLFTGSQDKRRFGIRFEYGSTEYLIGGDALVEGAVNEARRAAIDALAALDNTRTAVGGAFVPEVFTGVSDHLATVDRFLTILAGAVNRYTPTDNEADTVYAGFQSGIANARTALGAVRTDVIAAASAYNAAVSAELLAERELEGVVASVRLEDRTVGEEAVRVARAALRVADERVRDTELLAPLVGTVSRVDHRVGETVGPYEPIVEVLADGAYEIEAYVPEADIARVKPGDRASVRFDAFERNDVRTASVVRIAPSETLRGGVPTYKTTLVFLDIPQPSMIVRPGMTVTVDITTDTRADVLTIPARSVVWDGERSYVRTFDGLTLHERDVTIGLRGHEGTVEVLTGLSEGEEVVLYGTPME